MLNIQHRSLACFYYRGMRGNALFDVLCSVFDIAFMLVRLSYRYPYSRYGRTRCALLCSFVGFEHAVNLLVRYT